MEKFKNFWFNIKYYLWYIPLEWYYNVRDFIANIWRFKKILWTYRTWDSQYCVELFADSLEWLSKDIEKGWEENCSRMKKVKAINELVSLLRHCFDDTDFDTCNPETYDYTVPRERYAEIRETNREMIFNRIFKLIKGQSNNEFKDLEGLVDNEWYDKWVEQFDGSGLEGWWS